MLKKFFITSIFILIFLSSYAEEQKIVYLNVDMIMQQSIAGKSIKSQLEKLHKKNLEKFKKNDEILKNKEKKIYNLGKLFVPNLSKQKPTKNTPRQKAMDPLILNFP